MVGLIDTIHMMYTIGGPEIVFRDFREVCCNSCLLFLIMFRAREGIWRTVCEVLP